MCFQTRISMQLDDVIGQAQAVSTSVGEQGRIFDNIGSKLVSVSSKFPMVNGIMNGIRRKKNKVGADVECCLSDEGGSSSGLDLCVLHRWKYLNHCLQAQILVQDTLILAGVITVCTLFLLIYWWRK